MIMFTGTNLWSLGAKKGASSFYQTLRHYAENGYQVELVSCSRTEGLDIPGVSARHVNLDWLARMGQVRKIGFAFRLLVWFVFQIYVIAVGLRLTRLKQPVFLYAYEIAGVPATLLLGKLVGLPVVSRFQGTIMKPLMATPGWRFRYWDHWLALRARTELVIMANDGTEGDEVLKRLGAPDTAVRFWMNGVDINPVHCSDEDRASIRHSVGCGPDNLILLTVSRLVAWKRLDRIISAMPEIKRSVPEAKLVIVGDGDARPEYERLVQELGIGECVFFTGAALQADVAKYISVADVFVSLYDLSNVGNPLLEAMSLGKSVITLNNGGTGSMVSNDVNGVLLEPEALATLPEAVVKLLRDQARRACLGTAAKEHAQRTFWTWSQRMKQEILEVEQLCSGWNYREAEKSIGELH